MKASRAVVSLLVLSLFAGFALAQETKTPAAPDEKAMMDAWMMAATPGEAHKKLDVLVGSFDVKVKSWMKPGDAPAESTGVSEHKWVLGKRWIEQRFEGSFMGMPFLGIGYTGYDNVKKNFVGTWMDNMSTSVMVSTGSGDEKEMNFTASTPDPLTGRMVPMEEKIRILDKDTFVMEMHGPDPAGTMFKMMEIRYERKK